MNVIRVRQRIHCETLHIPQLKEMIGKTVEIIILEESVVPTLHTETMETFMAFAPKEESLSPEELDKLRAAAKDDKVLAALLEIAEAGGVDAQAIVELRAASVL